MPVANIAALFAKGDITALTAECKKIKKPQNANAELDPQKSDYTNDLESLFRAIISGKKVEISVKENPREYMAAVDGQAFNLSNLLANGNLNLIDLTKENFTQYEAYTRNKSCNNAKPREHSTDVDYEEYSTFPSPTYFEQQEKQFKSRLQRGPKSPSSEALSTINFSELHYAEKLAINVYTGDFGEFMNAFLRGKVIAAEDENDPTVISEEMQQEIRDAFIHSVMAISGLNKVSDTVIPGVFRDEKLSKATAEKVLPTRISKANGPESSSLTLESGFVSTSIGRAPNLAQGKTQSATSIHTFFSGSIVGKYIAPLSQHPDEAEFLMPPTKISWVYHEQVGNDHYFFAEQKHPVRLVPSKTEEAELAQAQEEELASPPEYETRRGSLTPTFDLRASHDYSAEPEKPSEEALTELQKIQVAHIRRILTYLQEENDKFINRYAGKTSGLRLFADSALKHANALALKEFLVSRMVESDADLLDNEGLILRSLQNYLERDKETLGKLSKVRSNKPSSKPSKPQVDEGLTIDQLLTKPKTVEQMLKNAEKAINLDPTSSPRSRYRGYETN